MRIWIISKYASSPMFGGYPTRQYFIAKNIKELTNADTYLISSRSLGITTAPSFGIRNSMKYKINGVNGVLLNGPTIKAGFSFKRIYSWVIFEMRLLWWSLWHKKYKPDIILISSLSLLTFLSGVFLKKIFKAKLIVEVRDIWPLTGQYIKGWGRKNIFIRILSKIEKLGYKKADLIVGTMPNLKGHVTNVLPKASYKVECIPMGFDEEYFHQISNHYNLSWFDKFFSMECFINKFIVGYAGSLGLANCVDQIIDAASLLQNNKIVFVILGDGPQKKELIQKVKKYNIQNVYFHGTVNRQYVQSFLKNCDLLLNIIPGKNPIYKYGISPNKWIDYMYSAKPILVTYDGYQSIINEAGCGKFIEPDNPKKLAEGILEFSAMSKQDRELMGKKGKAFLIKNMSYKILAQKYIDLMNNIKL